MIRFHTQLLARCAPPDTVFQQFIQTMLPGLQDALTVLMAKGGAFADQQAQRGFDASRYDLDQNMLSHLLNGIFPTLSLLQTLAERGIRELSVVAQKVYILGFLMHDVDKILKQQQRFLDVLLPKGGLRLYDAAAVARLQEVCEILLAEWGALDFWPDYSNYLGDIVFLAVNTQVAKGTSLTTYNFSTQLKERDLLLLRKLCTFSDLITYLVQSPSDIQFGSAAQNLNELLAYFSQDTLTFAYHKLTDQRGMLSNVLNISVTQFIERQGALSYLFFPTGVVYLWERNKTLLVEQSVLVNSVKEALQNICKERIQAVAPGFKFDPKSLVKKPDYYHDFLNPAEYLDLLIKQVLQLTKNDISVGPAEKLRELQRAEKIPNTLDVHFTPDVRVAVIARFLSALQTEVIDHLPKAVQPEAQKQLAASLQLTDYWADAQLIPNVGGFEYKWFWLGARYLAAHPGIDKYEGIGNLQDVFAQVCDDLHPVLQPHLESLYSGPYLQHIERYLLENLEIAPTGQPNWAGKSFAAELTYYTGSKRKTKRTLLCTMCHSDYPTTEQEDAAVLFQPWVYKNKLPLYATKNAGGICTICSLELMLRQVLLKGELRLTGKEFEQLRMKYFYVYPNYFFTRETATFLRYYVRRLRYINFFEIRKLIRKGSWGIADFLTLEDFVLAPEDADEFKDSGYAKMEYPENTFPGLVLFGMKVGGKDTDTEGWAVPAWLSLMLPLLLNVKVAVSESPIPLFASGQDFKESCILDGTPPYLNHVLTAERLRMDALLPNLVRLAGLYTVNIDTFTKQGSPEWNHLIPLARQVETDPINLFPYFKKQQRGDSAYAPDPQFFIQLVEQFETNLPQEYSRMSLIRNTVDLYTKFYSPGYKTHSVVKPLNMIAKEILKSSPTIDPEDLQLQLRGQLQQWLERVRKGGAEGYAKFRGTDISTQEIPAIEAFVRYVYEQVFLGYCQGQRGLLRTRLNAFQDGCEAYLTAKRAQERSDKLANAINADGEVSLTTENN